MNLSAQIAKQFRGIHFGGNWTSSNIKDNLMDITWQQVVMVSVLSWVSFT